MLILAAMGLAVTAALLVYTGLPLYRQYRAIHEIERLGGWIGAREGGPKWLRDWAGDEPMKAFDHVQAVRLGGTAIDDEGLARLAALTGLKWLDLDKTRITDEGLEHLTGLKHLETLRLNQTQTHDAALLHLAKLNRLRFLYLAETPVTEEGVARLQQSLPELHIER